MKTARNRYIVILLAICLILTACVPSTPEPTTVPITSTPPPGPATGWLQIYFTNPTDPNAHNYEGGPDQTLAAAIDSARLSVDMAAYSLNLWSIRNALVRAARRGVTVRMVMESDNMDGSEVQDLLDAGIPIIGDQQEGLMHDKFVIIDRSEVWIGSMNYTTNGAYLDNNNLLRIVSDQLAKNYSTEFEQMFTEHLFGPEKISDTPYPRLNLDGTTVENYFSPQDGIARHIVELVRNAKKSIHFMAFSFTSDDIGNAIRDQAQAGIVVSGVMDEGQINSNQGTEYDAFKQAGVDVRRDGIDGMMHHKVIIIDESIVITGSYNFTASAETRNDENVLIIFNADVAARYMSEFWSIYAMAKP
jgi:phosphatidylserine/phosphatidylglycerophosphate/cardiolipin synthase-like enzyme